MLQENATAAMDISASFGSGQRDRLGSGPQILRANRLAKAARAANRWNDVRKHYALKHAALSNAIVAGEVEAQDVSEQLLRNGQASLVIAVRDVGGRRVCVHGFYNHLTRRARERVDFLLYAARSAAARHSLVTVANR
jgi:hypothetical protein